VTNKLLNHVVETGKEMHAHYTHLAYEAKGDVQYRGASPFYFMCTKKIFNSIFSTWTSYPGKRVPCNEHTCCAG
jgi:hypothetical protein